MEVHDFLMGDDMDLNISGGDFEWGESTQEHQRGILLATKGCVRQYPAAGVGIVQELLNDASQDDLRRLVQGEMEADGMSVSRLRMEGETVELTAAYHA